MVTITKLSEKIVKYAQNGEVSAKSVALTPIRKRE